MRNIYTISTKEFQPISFGGNYLHDNYDNLVSFLKIKLKGEKSRLAKPIQKDDKSFDFFGDFKKPLKRISTFEKSIQDEILKSYNDYITNIENISSRLSRSKNKDEQDWGEILNCVFNRDDNIIISDGQDWILVWGWSFRNKDENYVPLTTIPVKSQDINSETPSPVKPIPPIPVTEEIQSEVESEDEEDIEDEDIEGEVDETSKKSKVGFFGYIKRFFRWISYRFWGLMMLIIYTLLVLCICRYCCKKECPDNCSELEQTEQELIKIKERLNERCLSDTLKQQ